MEKFLKRRKKGVSPVLSVLMIIIIAVAASLVTYAWVMGYIGFTSNKASKSIQIQSVAEVDGDLKVYVQNVGDGAVDFGQGSQVYIDGLFKPFTPDRSLLQKGETATLTILSEDLPPDLEGERVTIKVVTREGTFMEETTTITSGEGTGYTLTLIVSPLGSGSVTKNPDEPTYQSGDSVTLTAAADLGWTFSGWIGDISDTQNPKAIIVNGTHTITATFSQDEYTILTTMLPASGGYETRNDTGPYHYGDVVQLTAHANPGYTFDYWSGAGTGSSDVRTITVTGSMTAIAHFTQDEYTITVNPTPSNGYADWAPVQATYHYGDSVTLTAHPDPGWSFSAWGGDVSGSQSPKTIIVNGSITLTATFNQNAYTITTHTIGSGSVGKNPDQATYTYSSIVQLTATADPGWTFYDWSGDLTGSTNPDSITVTKDMDVTATFTQDQYAVTLNTVGSGTATKTPDLATYTYGTIVDLLATPAEGWSFGGWSASTPDIVIPSPSSTSTTATIYGAGTMTATFTQDQYTLTVNIVGSGSVSRDPDQATYTYGSSVQLTAGADPGWAFSGWIGDISDTQNPKTIIVNGTHTITATFTQNEYALTINIVGSGSVSKDPDQATYHFGDPVQLTANPTAGWSFSGWSGDLTGSTNPDSVTIDTDPSVTATFTPNQVQVTFAVDPSGRGATNPSIGPHTYNLGAVVSISASDANPGDDYVFCYWNATTGTATFGNKYAASTTATINGAGTITAYFRIPTTIDWYTTPQEMTLGGSYAVYGVLYPTGMWWFDGLNGKTVYLVYTAPNSTQIVRTYTTQPFLFIFNGVFGGQFTPDAVGTWQVYAQFYGDSEYNASRKGPVSFNVSPGPLGSITVVKDADPNDPQSFSFVGNGSLGVFSLVDNGGTPSQTFTNMPMGTYNITESGTSGWRLTGITISDPNGGSSSDLAKRTALIRLSTNGESVTVTFTNKKQYQVTFQQSGLSSDASGTVLTVGTTNYIYSQLPLTDMWVDDGTTYSYTATVPAGSGKQYVRTGVTGPSSPIHSSGTVTGSYKTQYRLTMATNFGTTTPAVGDTWYDASSQVTISATPPTPGAGEQYVWNGWAGSGSGSYTGTNNPATNAVTMNAPITETASWTRQYQVTVTASPSGAIGGTFSVTYTRSGTTHTNELHTTTWTEWADASTTVTVSSPQSPIGSYTFSSYTNNPATMNSAQTITIVYSLPPHYVDAMTVVHDNPNVGTHSSFTNMQNDGGYDTLTEADTDSSTGKMGRDTTSGTNYIVIDGDEMGGQVFTASGSGRIQSVTFNARSDSSSGNSRNVKAIITDSSGNILTNGISNVVVVPTTQGDYTATFATPPVVQNGQTYWIMIIPNNGLRLYYSSSSGGSSKYDNDNSYSTPTNPSDASSGTYNYRRLYASINYDNYQLDLEVQFSDVTDYDYYTQLQIKTGAFDSENLAVYYWNGSWQLLTNSLAPSTTNTFTVSLSGPTFDLRFYDTTRTGDTTQNTWQIDYVRFIAP